LTHIHVVFIVIYYQPASHYALVLKSPSVPLWSPDYYESPLFIRLADRFYPSIDPVSPLSFQRL